MLAFFKQVGLWWLVLMSGIASVILMALGALPNTSIETVGFWAASYVCLVAAVVLAWIKGRQELSKKISSLEARIQVGSPKKLERMQKLEDGITRGKAYLERIRSPYAERDGVPESAAFRDCMTWSHEVGQFLEEELPQYLKQFLDSASDKNVDHSVNGARSMYISRLNALEGISQHYSATQP